MRAIVKQADYFNLRTAEPVAAPPAPAAPKHQFQSQFEAMQTPDGGFSHNPIHNTDPTQRYMVALANGQGGVEQINHVSKLTPDHLAQHAQAAASQLKDPNTFQGGWHDPATSKTYLDISHQYNDLDSAMSAARQHKQLSIFDLHQGKSIPTTQAISA